MALPPISASSSSAARSGDSALTQAGSLFHASGDGDWNVNFSGASMQGGGLSLLTIAAIAAAAWFIFKK